MTYEVALIIPVYNEQEGVVTTLESFCKHLTNSFLLVVVDNASTDGTLAQLHAWQKTHPDRANVILTESRHGSMYARRKGLLFAKEHAKVVISSDADNTPLQGFVEDIKNFAQTSDCDVLVGHQQQDPHTRLVKQLFLPRLMDAIAWMEEIEKAVFGPFFFGGFFGIKSSKITPEIFSINNMTLPSEPSVLWSRHCHYSHYSFDYSHKTMQTSSRRFWADTQGFLSLQRKKIVRSAGTPTEQDIAHLSHLKQQQDVLITSRLEYYSRRLLLLLLDAVFFRSKLLDTTIVDMRISKACALLQIEPLAVYSLSQLPLYKAKATVIELYEHLAIKSLTSRYNDWLCEAKN